MPLIFVELRSAEKGVSTSILKAPPNFRKMLEVLNIFLNLCVNYTFIIKLPNLYLVTSFNFFCVDYFVFNINPDNLD